MAAGAAAALFLAAILPQREAIGYDFADRKRVNRWIAAGTFAASISFALEVAQHFWPNV